MIRILLIAMLIFSNALQSFAGERSSSASEAEITIVMVDEVADALDVQEEKKSCCHEGWLDKASGASCKPDCKMTSFTEVTAPQSAGVIYGVTPEVVPSYALTRLLFRPPIV